MCALPPFVFVQCAANLRCCEQCTSQFNDHKKNPSIQDVTTSIIFILTVCGLYYCISWFSAGNWCLVIVQRIKKRSCINENELFQHNLKKWKLVPFLVKEQLESYVLSKGKILTISQSCCATNVSTHTHLVFLGNKVVYDKHLETQLSAQLADVLQEALDLSVMLLLQICHLTQQTQGNCFGPLSNHN